jgi:hypothetical protein
MLTFPSILLPKNEDSMVSTLGFFVKPKTTALAVLSLYLETPNVQKGK